ncbi:hypothetical protein NDN08_005984 [Rhodosorus marinus]|uniref:Lon N-terminal domain-containing protein n=1 Tax=Rhodosorus marinus TaxID=101924 RepID=A0AAV8UL00_9RHOD|nr:hypothetical protein NDN08_005984 [Rhodosorus marinus]
MVGFVDSFGLLRVGGVGRRSCHGRRRRVVWKAEAEDGAFVKVAVDDKETVEAIKQGIDDEGTETDIIGHFFVETNNEMSKVGTRAAIIEKQDVFTPDGTSVLEMTCLGMSRLKMLEVVSASPFLADVEPFSDEPTEEDLFTTEKELLDTMSDVIQLSMKLTVKDGDGQGTLNELDRVVESLRDPSKMAGATGALNSALRHETVSFLIADLIDQPIYERRRLLESRDTKERMEYTIGYLEAQRSELAAKAAVMDAVG